MSTATLERPKRRKLKDKSSGAIFYVTGPIGEVIDLYLSGLDWSVDVLAAKADVHRSTIYKYIKSPSTHWGHFRIVLRLLNALGIQLIGSPE